MIANWNEVVERDDEVYFLGDFSLDFKRMKQVVPLLRGRIHLIAGNHDLCHPCHHNGSAYLARYVDAGFVDICESTFLPIEGEQVMLSHLPYYDIDDEDSRYPEFKPNDDGNWLLHGHVHQRWKIKGRQINVGVDVWDYYPVSIQEIQAVIAGGKTESLSA
ncbi:MAG TPA: metallophosphoesterase family protein [Chroococcales cyanobacterium]